MIVVAAQKTAGATTSNYVSRAVCPSCVPIVSDEGCVAAAYYARHTCDLCVRPCECTPRGVRLCKCRRVHTPASQIRASWMESPGGGVRLREPSPRESSRFPRCSTQKTIITRANIVLQSQSLYPNPVTTTFRVSGVLSRVLLSG